MRYQRLFGQSQGAGAAIATAAYAHAYAPEIDIVGTTARWKLRI
ncbi:hypothetical protein N9928_00140 [bacterium]|nr:hypothetical protein [bacterium]